MEINIPLKGEATINMAMEDIIDEINHLPLTKRFAYIGRILNELILTDQHDMTPEQRITIINFLESQYYNFTGKEPGKKKCGTVINALKGLF